MKTDNTLHSIGDRVSLVGLQKPGMNGKRGTIVSPLNVSKEGRYGVLVDGDAKPVAIKPANIVADSKSNHDGVLLQKGDRVTVGGLKTTRFNGRQGIIVCLPDSSKEGRYGVRINGERKPMGIKAANLMPLQKSTTQYKKEMDSLKYRETLTNEERMTADQMGFMRTMMETLLTEDNQVKVFGRKIEPMPDYRLEVMNKGVAFPKFVDYSWANKLLRQSYEEESALPHMMEILFARPGYKPSSKDIMKRLRSQDRFVWYNSPRKIGDIFQNSVVPLHGDCLRYSFSNQAYKKQILSQGKTHVAVGFVDLGILLAADLDPSGDAPLRFVGIDSSAYVVAKTLLIWELIEHAGSKSILGILDGEAYPRIIAQVWFSTTWSKGTQYAVHSALCSLLCKKCNSLEPMVRCILEYWLKTPSLPLKEARSRLQMLKSSISSIGILARKRDRIDVAKYALTGDFCVRDPVCGNVILLDCPDGTPPPADGETVFSALDFHQVMNIATENPQWTIIEAAERYALNGIAKLVSWCSMSLVSVELKCAAVQDVIEEIASMRPWTMSWSNVLDYIDPNEFHRLARECSRYGDTIHFGYSMNWTVDVFGTFLIDYEGRQCAELRKELLETSNKGLRVLYRSFGWEPYFRFPLPDNPMNTVGKSLQVAHYRTWTDHFFSLARRDGLFCEVGSIDCEMVSPLASTGDSTISFSWTYDSSVSLRVIPRSS